MPGRKRVADCDAMPHNNRMQSDFGKLRFPQPLMRGVMSNSINSGI